MSASRCTLALLTLALLVPLAAAEEAAAPAGPLVIVLDASGSMWGQIDGEHKVVIAKKALAELVAGLPAETKAGLVLYGHRRKGDCDDIELAVPVGPLDAAKLKAVIEGHNPKGKTPTTRALRQALEALGGAGTVLLVSDGKETCDADPCAAVKQLVGGLPGSKVHVVGFDVTDEEREELACIAEAGGGRYYPARSADELSFATAAATAAKEEAPASGEGKVWLDEGVEILVGAKFRVHFEAAPTFHKNAWAGIVPPEVPHGDEVVNERQLQDYAFIRGRTSGTVELTAPTKPGKYEVRLHDSDHRGREVSHVGFEVGPARGKLIFAESVVVAGAALEVGYEVPEGLADSAWVGVVPAHVPHGSSDVNDRHDISYSYIRQRPSGKVKLAGPTKPGRWDLRLHDADDKGNEIASVSFRVEVAEATITLNKTRFKIGEEIVITFEASTVLSSRAWAGIIPSHVPHGSEDVNDAHDVDYRYLPQQTQGVLKMAAPAKPGKYDVRLHDTDGGGNELDSVSFTVE